MPVETEVNTASQEKDWTRPQAMAIPRGGYFELEKGKHGPVFPRTPACHGFTIIAKIKPGREEVFRDYGKRLEKALEGDPYVLAPLCAGFCSISARRLISCTRGSSTPISINIPMMLSPCSRKPA
jgi:hypothetical protein